MFFVAHISVNACAGGTAQDLVAFKANKSTAWTNSWDLVTSVRDAQEKKLYDPVYRWWYAESCKAVENSRGTKNSGYGSKIEYDELDGDSHLSYTANIYNSSEYGFPYAVVLSQTSASALSQILAESIGNDRGLAYIVDRVGNLVCARYSFDDKCNSVCPGE